MTSTVPALLFEPDGYELSGPKLMGRQAAGNAFLRATVAYRGDAPLAAYTPHRRSAEVFAAMVHQLDPHAQTQWVPANRLDLLAQVGNLYLPGPGLDEAARLRLRAGPAAYSLCGVTHTTASHAAMGAIKSVLTAPVMPWDAVICTSHAVLATVQRVLEQERAYLHWRLGVDRLPPLPLLPVIPLGVHAQDYRFTDQERIDARVALGLSPDDVVALFVGRLSFHGKAHPHPMYVGLQAAAEQTGKSVALIQCGWFANESIETAFKQGAESTCPDVRALFTNGKDAAVRRQCWAAADLFISLSDNIQETFGLTPIEAMAAGLPVVVTDWDGYKDTVRDGLDGFRIPTWMPGAGHGQDWALAYEAGTTNYDRYCGLSCQTVAVDLQVLVARLVDLIERPALRQQLGAQARAHVAQCLDWSVVFKQYQALWDEQSLLRRAAGQAGSRWFGALAMAPRVDAARLDPFRAFEGYASQEISASTLVALAPGGRADELNALLSGPMFNYMGFDAEQLRARALLWAQLAAQPRSVAQLVRGCGAACSQHDAIIFVSQWAKVGAVTLSNG